MGLNHTYRRQHRAKRPPDVDLQLRMEFVLDRSARNEVSFDKLVTVV
jgi:hypothetical protein